MNRTDIKRNILQKIDEISPYANTDEQYDLLIEGMLDDMANRFYCEIPINFFPVSSLVPLSNISHGINEFIDMGMVKLPMDFLRFMSARCHHWNRTVTEKDLLNTESGEYNRQFDRHTRAGVAKPKIFIDKAMKPNTIPPQGGQPPYYMENGLTVCPFRQNWMVSDLHIRYIAKTVAEYIYDELLDGFFYYVANAVLTSMRQVDFANAMKGKFEEWVNAYSIKN